MTTQPQIQPQVSSPVMPDTIECFNPATGEKLGNVPAMTPD